MIGKKIIFVLILLLIFYILIDENISFKRNYYISNSNQFLSQKKNLKFKKTTKIPRNIFLTHKNLNLINFYKIILNLKKYKI